MTGLPVPPRYRDWMRLALAEAERHADRARDSGPFLADAVRAGKAPARPGEAGAPPAGGRGAAEVPVGAIVVDADGRMLGRGRNAREESSDPSAHAEVMALRAAGRASGTWRLSGATMVVTLEPCVMCAGAIRQARLARVVFGAWDAKAGAGGSVCDVLRDGLLPYPVPEVYAGVEEEPCAALLARFFESRRGR